MCNNNTLSQGDFSTSWWKYPQRPTTLPTDEEWLRLYAIVQGDEAMKSHRREMTLWAEDSSGNCHRKVKEFFAKKGKLTWGDFVRCRIRYFTDGAVIGSRAWVDHAFMENRHRFGPKRQDGVRRFKFLADPAIFGLRDLRISPLSLPSSDSKV